MLLEDVVRNSIEEIHRQMEIQGGNANIEKLSGNVAKEEFYRGCLWGLGFSLGSIEAHLSELRAHYKVGDDISKCKQHKDG